MIIFAVKKLIRVELKGVVPIIKSPWVVIEMDKKQNAEKLLKQAVVFDPAKRILVLFQRPLLRPSDERVFEIRNVKYREDLQDLEDALASGGLTITSQSPRTKKWLSTYTEQIIWKIKAPSTDWQTLTKATSTRFMLLTLHPAPICSICQLDEHHNRSCGW